MWMDYYGRDGDVGQHMLLSTRGRAVQRSHRAGTLMAMMIWHACARQKRFSRFAVARDETNKEAVSDVSLKSAWGRTNKNRIRRSAKCV